MDDVSRLNPSGRANTGPAGAETAASGPPPEPAPVAPVVEEPETVSILLVDDNASKMMATEAVLSHLNQTIVKARSGREALQLLLKQEVAVILLDVNMPEMDGFETAAMIRQRPRLQHTPIIFVTGYNTTDIDRLKGYGIGAADYLFLPVIPEVLKAKVKAFVDLALQRKIIERQAERLVQQNKQQEEQIRTIRELNKRLQVANEELEAFSYTVSHDLRSPLRAMQGYSQALLHDHKGKLNPDGDEYLTRISRAAVRMDSLIQDVLAYSRVMKSDITVQPINLEELLTQLLQEHQALKCAPVKLEFRRPIHNIHGHEACLSQCVSNLLDNALKFIAQGVTPEITLWTEHHGDRVRLFIQDNGIGIDAADHKRIFTMFGRVHHAKVYMGTGIGLPIVKKAAERMGGTVGLESELGKGSKFWIELPVAKL